MNLLSAVAEPFQLVGRYQRLLWCFSRYGMIGSITSLGIEFGKRGITWVAPQTIHHTDFDSVFGKNLAKTFQEMGPTFIKLGQVLATRPDVVGEGDL